MQYTFAVARNLPKRRPAQMSNKLLQAIHTFLIICRVQVPTCLNMLRWCMEIVVDRGGEGGWGGGYMYMIIAPALSSTNLLLSRTVYCAIRRTPLDLSNF